MQRTSCQPREVCVEVAEEYPEYTSPYYLPRCVALHRCGGCCNTESFYCSNTSYTLVNKTVRCGRRRRRHNKKQTRKSFTIDACHWNASSATC